MDSFLFRKAREQRDRAFNAKPESFGSVILFRQDPGWLRRQRPFDWHRDCPADLSRPFPPIVGRGRGYNLHGPAAGRMTRTEFVDYMTHEAAMTAPLR